MRNKNFIFPALFLVFLLGFLGYPKISSATISVTTDAATAISTTTAVLNGTLTTTVNSETYDRRGFNLGTASATRGNYDLGSSTDAQAFVGPVSAGGTAFSHTTTTLSGTTPLAPGTLYYFRGYVKYGDELTFLTKPVEPATSTFSVSSFADRIKITWTAGTGNEKTMIRYNDGTTYPTSITAGNQAYWDNGTEVTLYNLPQNHTYYFRAWSSTSDGGLTQQSDSYGSVMSATTAASRSGRSYTVPTTYTDSLIINEGAAITESREVTLKLKAGDANLMSISNDNLFLVPLETYATTKTWTLPAGDGKKTIYAKFVSSDGVNSGVISATITLTTPTAPIIPITPTPPTPAVEEPIVAETPVELTEEKPISEMTAEELKAKIAEILIQAQNLQSQLAQLKEVGEGEIEGCNIGSFDRNIRAGYVGEDVKCLQIILNSDSATQVAVSGVGSSGNETAYFGDLTKAAVVKFQEKYAQDILVPYDITKGTGVVAQTTRNKLNELLGK
ncbi:MAG: FlxA-like family protein [Candidatus Nealsonbacteria bacterium]|nr:FlxA-like family protein [Candidatus Nealsonbacteria bacterium]